MELALNVSKEELKYLIKDAVREVIEESSWEWFMKNLEYVSDKEMEETLNFRGQANSLLSIAISTFTGWAVGWSFTAIVLSVGVCAVIGLVFGIYPAVQASRLDPIEALRHD